MKMPTHSTSAYKDDQKWIVFCKKCGLEEPFESQECSERYLKIEIKFRIKRSLIKASLAFYFYISRLKDFRVLKKMT